MKWAQFSNRETITEVSAANDIDRARYSIKSNQGLSFKTTVAFGPHSSIPYFETFNETDMVVTDREPVILDSGGQYLEGTTILSRTSKIHRIVYAGFRQLIIWYIIFSTFR